MEFNDIVYGEFSAREPVIQELVESAPMQRLKGINQAGALFYVDPAKYANTRFQHSLGVYYLLRKFGAGMEEQIAGLLHDVSHTAFSHVTDYLFEGGAETQEYHESLKEKVIMESMIPSILEKYGFKLGRVMDEGRHKLLERPLPALCADRIDYFLRDAVAYGLSAGIREEARTFLSALQIFKGEFVFSNIEIAKKASLAFMECGRLFWSAPEQAASYKILADAIKLSMASGEVSMDDLLLTDQGLYAKLQSSGNTEVRGRLTLLPGLDKSLGSMASRLALKTKVRYIDPKVLQNGKARLLSGFDSGYKDAIESYVEKIKKGLGKGG